MGSFQDYFAGLATAQLMSAYCRVTEMNKDVWNPLVTQMLSNLEAARPRLQEALIESEGGPSDRVKQYIIGLMDDAFIETKQYVLGDVDLGKQILGPNGLPITVARPLLAGSVRSIARWISTSPVADIVKRGLAVLGLVGAAAVGGTYLVRWWRDPDIEGFAHQNARLEAMYAERINECEGNQECISAAQDELSALRRRVGDFYGVEKADGGECGLLDTPMAAALGIVFGIGFGWGAMRRIERM